MGYKSARIPSWAGAHRSQRGFALPFALILTFLIITLGLAFLELSRMEAVSAMVDMEETQALQAAEYGLERAKIMGQSQRAPWVNMTYDGSPLTFSASSDPIFNGNQICELFSDETVGDPTGSIYTVVVENALGASPQSRQYRIHSFGTCGARTRHVVLEALAATYSSFAWCTNDENSQYFATGETVDGWYHTNDQLNVWGDPVFQGRVTTVNPEVNYGQGGPPWDNPEFQEGISTGYLEIDIDLLLTETYLTLIRTMAQNGGIWLPAYNNKTYEVVFFPGGNATVKRPKAKGGGTEIYIQQDLATTNGTIYSEEAITVKGQLNGVVTLVTADGKDINIIDDLVYAYPSDANKVFQDDFDPNDPFFNDKLFLVSGGDVILRKSWSSSWGRLNIMGNILALDGSFYNLYPDRWPLKYLYVYGGVVQDSAGPIGQQGERGLLRDLRFDPRLLLTPTWFPTVAYDYTTWRLNP